MSDSMDGKVEIYDTRTGIKGRVPPEFVDDPILGRFLKKTPGQRRLDGELESLPTEESTVEEIREFADLAEVDLTGLKKKDDLLAAVLDTVGDEADLPTVPDPDIPVTTDLDNPDDPDDSSGQTPA